MDSTIFNPGTFNTSGRFCAIQIPVSWEGIDTKTLALSTPEENFIWYMPQSILGPITTAWKERAAFELFEQEQKTDASSSSE